MIHVSRTAIGLFGLEIHWYALLIVLGIVLGLILALKRERRLGLPRDTSLDIALICIPAAIVGARAYYVLFSWDSFAGQPFWKVFALWEGGMAIYGGLIAALLAGAIVARTKKLSFLRLADLAAPSIALGQAIGRWGNFVNQEAHGALTESPALQFFPASVLIDGRWYYATFFYESMWCFLIVALLLLAEKKLPGRKTGDLFFGYVFLYGLERAVVEGLRTDSLYLGPFRVSQALSLLAVLAVTILWSLRMKKASKALRLLPPLCALNGVAACAAGGVPVAAAATLVSTLVMFIGQSQKPEKRSETV